MKDTLRNWRGTALAMAFFLGVGGFAAAQPTTGSIVGTVADQSGGVLPGATVAAIHVPSGTRYESVTRGDGRFAIQGVRVGGPYAVTVSMSGFQTGTRTDIYNVV